MIDPSWNEPVVLPFPVRRSVFAVVFGPLVIDPVWNTGAAGSLAGHPAAKEVQLVLCHITEGIDDCSSSKDFRTSLVEFCISDCLGEADAYDLPVPIIKCFQEVIAFNADGGQEFLPESPSTSPLVLCAFSRCSFCGISSRIEEIQDTISVGRGDRLKSFGS